MKTDFDEWKEWKSKGLIETTQITFKSDHSLKWNKATKLIIDDNLKASSEDVWRQTLGKI